jgi:hypothetical protein
MKRDEIIAKIRENAEALRSLGAASIYLCGSHVRETAGRRPVDTNRPSSGTEARHRAGRGEGALDD